MLMWKLFLQALFLGKADFLGQACMIDSCNVMRGSKSGLEKRMCSTFAVNLLHIDGDCAHHVLDSAKQFCKPFNKHIDNLRDDLFLDVK